jgi:hypothetical protein
MLSRFWFALIAVFWLTMNALLWQAEFGSGARGGSPVSQDVVLEKVLTAPDGSTLEILRNDRNVGYLHWYPDPGDDAEAGDPMAEDYVPEGMLKARREYAVRLDGWLMPEGMGTRLRFSLELRLSADRKWEAFRAQLGARPSLIEISAEASTQRIEARYGFGDNVTTRSFTFAELKDPATWSALQGDHPILGLALPLMPMTHFREATSQLAWTARTDWIRIGGSKARVYRLEATLFDRHKVSLVVNRVGEVMRAELPSNIRLVSDVLTSL